MWVFRSIAGSDCCGPPYQATNPFNLTEAHSLSEMMDFELEWDDVCSTVNRGLQVGTERATSLLTAFLGAFIVLNSLYFLSFSFLFCSVNSPLWRTT